MRSAVVHPLGDTTVISSWNNPANLIFQSGWSSMVRAQQRFGLKELIDLDASLSLQQKSWGGIRLGWVRRGTGDFTTDQCIIQAHHWLGERASIGIGIRFHRQPFILSSLRWTGAVEIGAVHNILPQTMIGWHFISAQQSWTAFRWQNPSVWEYKGALGHAWTSDFWTSFQWEKQPNKPLRLRIETRYSPASSILFQTGIGADWSIWLGMQLSQSKNTWTFQGMKHPTLGWSISMSWTRLKIKAND